MKRNKKRQLDLSKVAGGAKNDTDTSVYTFNDSFDFVDDEGTNYKGDIDSKTTTTKTSYNISETTVKKGGSLSDLMNKIKKG